MTAQSPSEAHSTFMLCTVECCVNCNTPKVPSDDPRKGKCQNRHCPAFDEPQDSVSYRLARIPFAAIKEALDSRPERRGG